MTLKLTVTRTHSVAFCADGHGHYISKPRRLRQSVEALERPALAEARRGASVNVEHCT